jgi:hypothetical protein
MEEERGVHRVLVSSDVVHMFISQKALGTLPEDGNVSRNI